SVSSCGACRGLVRNIPPERETIGVEELAFFATAWGTKHDGTQVSDDRGDEPGSRNGLGDRPAPPGEAGRRTGLFRGVHKFRTIEESNEFRRTWTRERALRMRPVSDGSNDP